MLPKAAATLWVVLTAARVAAFGPARDFSGVDALATHGRAVLAGTPRAGLLLSHTDLHWNPTR